MLTAPCKDCPDRKIGCHSICEKYIEFDKKRKEFLAMKSEVNRLQGDIYYSAKKREKRW